MAPRLLVLALVAAACGDGARPAILLRVSLEAAAVERATEVRVRFHPVDQTVFPMAPEAMTAGVVTRYEGGDLTLVFARPAFALADTFEVRLLVEGQASIQAEVTAEARNAAGLVARSSDRLVVLVDAAQRQPVEVRLSCVSPGRCEPVFGDPIDTRRGLVLYGSGAAALPELAVALGDVDPSGNLQNLELALADPAVDASNGVVALIRGRSEAELQGARARRPFGCGADGGPHDLCLVFTRQPDAAVRLGSALVFARLGADALGGAQALLVGAPGARSPDPGGGTLGAVFIVPSRLLQQAGQLAIEELLCSTHGEADCVRALYGREAGPDLELGRALAVVQLGGQPRLAVGARGRVYVLPADDFSQRTVFQIGPPSGTAVADAVQVDATLLQGDARSLFGASLAAGDADGDGLDELFVGAPNAEQGTGAVYVFDGRMLMQGGTVDVSAPGGGLVTITGDGLGFGQAIATAELGGAPGFADLVVGSPGTREHPDGAVHVFLDGTLDGSSRQVSPQARALLLIGPGGGDRLGTSLLGADRLLVAGAPGAEQGRGRAYVLRDPLASAGGQPTVAVEGTAQALVTGGEPEERLGTVLGRGEFDATDDGAELVVGAGGLFDDERMSRVGGAYLLFQGGDR